VRAYVRAYPRFFFFPFWPEAWYTSRLPFNSCSHSCQCVPFRYLPLLPKLVPAIRTVFNETYKGEDESDEEELVDASGNKASAADKGDPDAPGAKQAKKGKHSKGDAQPLKAPVQGEGVSKGQGKRKGGPDVGEAK
jgi:hypothetical protein